MGVSTGRKRSSWTSANETVKEGKQQLPATPRLAWQQKCEGVPAHLPDWLTGVTGPPDALQQFSDVCVGSMHVYDHRGNRFYRSVYVNNFGVCAPFVSVYMSVCTLRALCLFRLGMAPLRMYTGRQTVPSTPVLARTCEFCERKCGRRVLEDEYHVCVECPLYDNLRVNLFFKLMSRGLSFFRMRNLMCVCVSVLCVRDPSMVRAVGQYLADCLATRDVFLSVRPSKWCKPSRVKALEACVQTAPVVSQHTLKFLRQVSMCDTTPALPFSRYLEEIWFT